MDNNYSHQTAPNLVASSQKNCLSWFTGGVESVTSGVTQGENIVHGDFVASCGDGLSNKA